MSKTTSIFFLFFLSILALTQLSVHSAPERAPSLEITNETTIWKIMSNLGKVNVNVLDKNEQSSKEKGEQLITQGYTTSFKGNKTAATSSSKLTCIACHTKQKEHPNANTINPKSRLEYGDSMNIPFLPGAPFYGLVNRIAFFTNDYQEKFVHKNKAAIQSGHRNIRKAIQACNTLYAKGRTLAPWEIESILAYLWTLELKVSDLEIPPSVINTVESAINTNKNNARAVNLMRRYYKEIYPASLVRPLPIEERNLISPILNDFGSGKKVYKLSCLYCHANKKYAGLRLDKSQQTFKFLKKNFDVDSRYSIYDATRYSPDSKGNKTNPPHYTEQRMSNQQLQDLRFYITQKAKMGNEADSYYNNF